MPNYPSTQSSSSHPLWSTVFLSHFLLSPVTHMVYLLLSTLSPGISSDSTVTIMTFPSPTIISCGTMITTVTAYGLWFTLLIYTTIHSIKTITSCNQSVIPNHPSVADMTWPSYPLFTHMTPQWSFRHLLAIIIIFHLHKELWRPWSTTASNGTLLIR